MEKKKQIVILGAGPAGLALAMKLLQRKNPDWEITVVEQKEYAGGISASFVVDGLYFDFGSHRLHPATRPEIMQMLQKLLGDDLLNRPRNGRIRLKGSFVKFPLNPVDLVLHLPFSFVFGFIWDMVGKPFRKKHVPQTSFADALLDGLGSTMSETFYFPYARKLWGLDPEKLSVIQAQKRVSADSPLKIIKKVLSLLPGIKRGNAGRFFYPRKGFGQISAALAVEVERLGGHLLLSTTAEEIVIDKDAKPSLIKLKKNNSSSNEIQNIYCDFMFSTIPVTVLARLLSPGPPALVVNAYNKLKYRAMILHYLVLETNQFTPFDAHYIPEDGVIMSRLSETKNYSNSTQPQGLTGLCSEIPCNVGDDIWNLPDEVLTERVLKDLKKLDLPVNCKVRSFFTKKLPFVYPIYDQDFDKNFKLIIEYFDQFSNFITLGRQGLFAHDNTHHTIDMAFHAADCLDTDLNWNEDEWNNCLIEFEKHVVED